MKLINYQKKSRKHANCHHNHDDPIPAKLLVYFSEI